MRPALAEVQPIFAASSSPPAQRALHNVEAEAAILGAILSRNDLLIEIGGLTSRHFSEPLHQRIFERISALAAQGAKVTPVTLRPYFEHDQDLCELGGLPYLARLTGNAQGLLAPRELADQLKDLAARRQRLEWLEAETATCTDIATPLREITVPALASAARALECLDLAALAHTEPEPKQFIIPRLAPAGEVTLFTGAGAVGKSLLAQQLATALAAGIRTLGLDLDRAPAIYLTCEDDAAQLHWRQSHICKALGIGMATLAGHLHLISLRGQPDSALATIEQGRLTPAPLYGRLVELLRSTGARLACLDNVAHLFAGNENDRGEVTQFINLLNRLAGDTGAAILLLGHPNKGGDTYSGSTAWLNAVRSQVTMERPKDCEHDPDIRSVHLGKPNYVQSGEAFKCRWSDWAFIRDEDLPEDKRDQLSQAIAVSGENAAFLECLRARAEQGDARSVGPSPGPNYAPSQFEGMPQAKGHDRHALKRAMERLLNIRRIECVTVRNTQKGRDVTVLREVPEGIFGGTPNASPNASRTLFPDAPEPRPSAPRTYPEHTPPPTGEGVGATLGGPHPTPPERN